jgi:sterol desaturase/sphingolipid hydroxylase (fatty acid hydroxylase superfamily)
MTTRKAVAAGAVIVVMLGVLYWLVGDLQLFVKHPHLIAELADRIVVEPVRKLFAEAVFTVPFAVVLVLTLVLERLFPAKPDQPIIGVSFAHDVVWFVYETVLHAVVIVTYVALLTAIYHHWFEAFTFTAAGAWPSWLRFAVAVLLLDFLYWGQHVTHHKVAMLWQLHAVHHSQRTLNFFTDFRYHILEYFVRHTWLVIPFLVFDVSAPRIVWYSLVTRWYTRFYHGNIRTNLGWLRYVLVTPQSHRVHHSIEPQHRDRNFGSLFSIWDYLLGTQYRRYDEYPETGIDDAAFPHEVRIGARSLLLGPLIQMAYPLRRLGVLSRREAVVAKATARPPRKRLRA